MASSGEDTQQRLNEYGKRPGVMGAIARAAAKRPVIWLAPVAVALVIGGSTRIPIDPAGALDALPADSSALARDEALPPPPLVQSSPQLLDDSHFRQTIGNSVADRNGQPTLRVQGYAYSGDLTKVRALTDAGVNAPGQGFAVQVVYVPTEGEQAPVSIGMYDAQTLAPIGGERTPSLAPVDGSFTTDVETLQGKIFTSGTYGCGLSSKSVLVVAEYDRPVVTNFYLPPNVVEVGRFNVALVNGERCELLPDDSDFGLSDEGTDLGEIATRTTDFGLS